MSDINSLEMLFPMKKISFLGRPTQIFCQNENGPCPLLAIANVMILRNKLRFHPDIGVVFLSDVVQEVGNLFVESRATVPEIDESLLYDDNSTALGANIVVDSALRILPTLARGLDLNIKFNDVTSFEYTEELCVFDALNINLYHTWVVDDEDTMRVILHDMSYNNLVFKVAEYHSLLEKSNEAKKKAELVIVEDQVKCNDVEVDLLNFDEPINSQSSSDESSSSNPDHKSHQKEPSQEPVQEPTSEINISVNVSVNESQSAVENKISSEPSSEESKPVKLSDEEDDLLSMGPLYEDFLVSNSSQMTYIGLHKLYSTLKERELGILFHNNHFSTVFKFQSKLYLLVTDVGFQNENVVWELLDEINGNTVFADSHFLIIRDGQRYVKGPRTLGLRELNDKLINQETIVQLPGQEVEQAQGNDNLVPEEEYYSEGEFIDSPQFDNDLNLAIQLQREEEMRMLEAEQLRQEAQINQSTASRITAAAASSNRPVAQTASAEYSQESQYEEQRRALEFYQQQHQAKLYKDIKTSENQSATQSNHSKKSSNSCIIS